MTKQRFEELERRSKNDAMQLCFEVFCEEKQNIQREQFKSLFSAWLQLFKGGDASAAITYFKANKLV